MKSLVIKGLLSYKPEKCYKCNHKYDKRIVFNGTKTSFIKIPSVSKLSTYLELKKQRLLCKHCDKTFTLECTEVTIMKQDIVIFHIKRSMLYL